MVYVLVFLVLLGWVLNALSKKYGLLKVTLQRKIGRTVVEIDEEFTITIVIENGKLLPVTFLQVEEHFPAALEYKFKADTLSTAEYVLHKATFLLKPYERVSRVYTVKAKKRGNFTFRDATLIGGDLLALNTFSQELKSEQNIIVLPKPLSLKEHLKPYGDYYGDLSVQRWIIEDPILMTGVREYTGFESERTIHWPSTLRTGHLMVKKFDFTTENSVMILLNIECAKPFWLNINGDKIEKCISLARGIVDELEQSGIPYGLCSDAYVSGSSNLLNLVNPGIGPYHYAEVVESLGRMVNTLSLSFEELLLKFTRTGTGYSTCLLITPTVLESYIYGINSLSQTAAKMVVIALDEINLEHLAGNILKYCERGD